MDGGRLDNFHQDMCRRSPGKSVSVDFLFCFSVRWLLKALLTVRELEDTFTFAYRREALSMRSPRV